MHNGTEASPAVTESEPSVGAKPAAWAKPAAGLPWPITAGSEIHACAVAA